MPIISDYTQAYHGTNTYKHLEIPMPNYTAGDLLIAILTTDTGTPTLMGGMPLSSCQYDDGGAWTDYTPQANDSTTADFYPVATTPAVNDAIYFGSDTIFNQVNILISTQGAGTWTNVFEYCTSADGNTWADCADTDGTTSWKAVNTVHAAMTWTPAADWVKCTKNGVEAYYVRSRVSAYTSISTRPICTQAFVISVNTRLNGWNPLFAYNGGQSSEAGIGVAWRIASASEADTTIFYSNAETANGVIISCRDTALSVSTVINEFTGVALATIAVNATNRTFTRSDVGGNFTTDGFVAGMAIRTTGFTAGGDNTYKIIESVTDTVITVTSDAGLVTESGTGNERIWSSPFNTSAIYVGKSKAATNNDDGLGTGKGYLPTLTTDINNCLLFYVMTITAAGVPSIIEGPCQLGAAKDGSAHADGWSWGFQATAGVTPATVIGMQMAALVKGSVVFAVNPPPTGATVIPGYTASDSSVYVSPFTGASYNGDSATTNTITTPFTGTINGKLLATGGTTVTRADSGINSYHAMANVAGVVTPGRWAGNRTTIVARTTLASKNILFHIQPYLPIDIQTTDSISLLGVMGTAIGLASTAGNFKVWHVGGAGTGWGTQRHSPCVINTDATDGKIQDTGTFVPASITEVGLMVSAKVVIAQWLCGSIWALDTCVIAGGSSSEPLNVEQIIKAYADGHERRSAIKQGAGQMLVLGPLQLGNGGTNPIYLQLDSTAIEFPRQYSKAYKEVYYNSVDNYCGITYYAGASDHIIHKNSVVSSPSKFHWKIHASSSVDAEYDFEGLQIIGSGNVQLLSGVTFSGMSFSDCSSFTQNGATLINCSFNGTKVTSASPAAAALISDCSFLSSGSGHAIEIGGTVEDMELDGVTFSGYSGTSTDAPIYVNIASGIMSITIIGGGSTPTIRTSGATVNVIVNPVTITVHVQDINTNADIEGARVLIKVANGSYKPYQASVVLARSGSTVTVTHTTHGLATNDWVVIAGATEGDYNGVWQITYASVDTYTFNIGSKTPTSPATGSPIATFAPIHGVTDSEGDISDTRVWSGNQLYTGWVRAWLSTKYKTSPISGTINSTSGGSLTVGMIPD